MIDLINCRVVVLISANAEWKVMLNLHPGVELQTSKPGDWFQVNLSVAGHLEPVIFFHGGWGKIAAAASTQYVIDQWQPDLLVNLGTCGGFEGVVETGEILLVDRTLVYDIVEQMGDSAAAVDHYATTIDLTWLRETLPNSGPNSGAKPVRRSLLVSADKDLIADEIPYLQNEYNAIAGDWESGAIAYVASQNQTNCLILRGVSDLVGLGSGEAYGDPELWVERTALIMGNLVAVLPEWLACALDQ